MEDALQAIVDLQLSERAKRDTCQFKDVQDWYDATKILGSTKVMGECLYTASNAAHHSHQLQSSLSITKRFGLKSTTRRRKAQRKAKFSENERNVHIEVSLLLWPVSDAVRNKYTSQGSMARD